MSFSSSALVRVTVSPRLESLLNRIHLSQGPRNDVVLKAPVAILAKGYACKRRESPGIMPGGDVGDRFMYRAYSGKATLIDLEFIGRVFTRKTR